MNYNSFFSHIYAEKGVWDYPVARKIRSVFEDSRFIPITHYKDVFCKKGQDFITQKNSPKLILAIKSDSWFYKGSEMCDSFGHANFIYTSEMMNCLYNCEYCYLRGMYNSANIVIFVNQDDCFNVIERVLPPFICVSYDSDMLALEYLTGFTRGWLEFCRKHPEAEIELRTKSSAFKYISDIPPLPNVTLAWTLSPDAVISQFEKGAPPLASRLASIREAINRGWAVRICIDPIIKFNGWRESYQNLVQLIKDAIEDIINSDSFADVSIGAFRAPPDYYNRMRKLTPYSEILAYPVIERSGGMRYPDEEDVIEYVRRLFIDH